MEESVADINPFNFLKGNSSKADPDEPDAAHVPPRPKVRFDPKDLYYDMSGEKHLVIFNHRHFECTRYFGNRRPEERKHTEEDVRRIKEVFGDKLGFKVISHDNKSYCDLWKILTNMKKQDYTTVSCLCIVILTHGSHGSELYAADRPYNLMDVIKLFEGHPTLATKPKLFFVQACRGLNKDSGVKVAYDGPEDDQTMLVPSHIDFLLTRSCVEDYVSYRDGRGSWLIQELCNYVERYYWDLDILRIITLVNNEIAFNRSSYTRDVAGRNKKQTPETVFNLTKFLKFS